MGAGGPREERSGSRGPEGPRRAIVADTERAAALGVLGAFVFLLLRSVVLLVHLSAHVLYWSVYVSGVFVCSAFVC